MDKVVYHRHWETGIINFKLLITVNSLHKHASPIRYMDEGYKFQQYGFIQMHSCN